MPPPPDERLALLLELGELAPRVLDPVVHVEAFRAAHQAAAEDEEALEAAGVLHGRLGALEHPVGLGDLLLDAGQVVAVGAAALRRGKFLLELHAADLLLAHALRQTGLSPPMSAAPHRASSARHGPPAGRAAATTRQKPR